MGVELDSVIMAEHDQQGGGSKNDASKERSSMADSAQSHDLAKESKSTIKRFDCDGDNGQCHRQGERGFTRKDRLRAHKREMHSMGIPNPGRRRSERKSTLPLGNLQKSASFEKPEKKAFAKVSKPKSTKPSNSNPEMGKQPLSPVRATDTAGQKGSMHHPDPVYTTASSNGSSGLFRFKSNMPSQQIPDMTRPTTANPQMPLEVFEYHFQEPNKDFRKINGTEEDGPGNSSSLSTGSSLGTVLGDKLKVRPILSSQLKVRPTYKVSGSYIGGRSARLKLQQARARANFDIDRESSPTNEYPYFNVPRILYGGRQAHENKDSEQPVARSGSQRFTPVQSRPQSASSNDISTVHIKTEDAGSEHGEKPLPKSQLLRLICGRREAPSNAPTSSNNQQSNIQDDRMEGEEY